MLRGTICVLLSPKKRRSESEGIKPPNRKRNKMFFDPLMFSFKARVHGLLQKRIQHTAILLLETRSSRKQASPFFFFFLPAVEMIQTAHLVGARTPKGFLSHGTQPAFAFPRDDIT